MYREDEKGRPLCEVEFCSEPARFNFQTGQMTYLIDGKGKYDRGEFDPDGQENVFRCEAHEQDY